MSCYLDTLYNFLRSMLHVCSSVFKETPPEKKLVSHIKNLWDKYSLSVDYASTTNFLDASYIYNLKDELLTPQVHFIGNVLAHYICSYDPCESVTSFNTIDVMKLVLVLDMPLSTIINSLHKVRKIFERLDKIQEAVDLCQLDRIRSVLANVYARQVYMQTVIKNYNRRVLLSFRLNHSQQCTKDIFPYLQWGIGNDFANGMETIMKSGGVIEDLEDLLDQDVNLRIDEMYGYNIMSNRVVCYFDYVWHCPSL
jgi:hypothetical protein